MTAPRMRVPMRQRMQALSEDDVQASALRVPSVGVRFSLDVAEEALAHMGRQALPFCTEKLVERVIHENAPQIGEVVRRYLWDREWAKPIIEDEIRRTVRECVREMMASSKLAEILTGGPDHGSV